MLFRTLPFTVCFTRYGVNIECVWLLPFFFFFCWPHFRSKLLYVCTMMMMTTTVNSLYMVGGSKMNDEFQTIWRKGEQTYREKKIHLMLLLLYMFVSVHMPLKHFLFLLLLGLIKHLRIKFWKKKWISIIY